MAQLQQLGVSPAPPAADAAAATDPTDQTDPAPAPSHAAPAPSSEIAGDVASVADSADSSAALAAADGQAAGLAAEVVSAAVTGAVAAFLARAAAAARPQDGSPEVTAARTADASVSAGQGSVSSADPLHGIPHGRCLGPTSTIGAAPAHAASGGGGSGPAGGAVVAVRYDPATEAAKDGVAQRPRLIVEGPPAIAERYAVSVPADTPIGGSFVAQVSSSMTVAIGAGCGRAGCAWGRLGNAGDGRGWPGVAGNGWEWLGVVGRG